ncbi:hypothetical protein ABH931_007205 [Streptacidiphilus sp. MAP12-33]
MGVNPVRGRDEAYAVACAVGPRGHAVTGQQGTAARLRLRRRGGRRGGRPESAIPDPLRPGKSPHRFVVRPVSDNAYAGWRCATPAHGGFRATGPLQGSILAERDEIPPCRSLSNWLRQAGHIPHDAGEGVDHRRRRRPEESRSRRPCQAGHRRHSVTFSSDSASTRVWQARTRVVRPHVHQSQPSDGTLPRCRCHSTDAALTSRADSKGPRLPPRGPLPLLHASSPPSRPPNGRPRTRQPPTGTPWSDRDGQIATAASSSACASGMRGMGSWLKA